MCFHLSLYEALKPNYFNLFFMLMKRAEWLFHREWWGSEMQARLSLQMVVGFGP